jgi:hypothetical protein
MARRVNKLHVLRNAMGSGELITNEDKAWAREMVANASIQRATLLNKLIDTRRDIDLECGYPKELNTSQYKLMYDREGLASRVVSIYPEESWANDPMILQTEDPTETEFEKQWAELEEELQVFSYMNKVDEISGIGRFGVLLLGLDDGLELNQPVKGLDEKGEKVGDASHQLLYLRAFDESVVTVKDTEKDRNNPRYGKPTLYSITFETIANTRDASGQVSATTGREFNVHWHRIIHVADNRKSSEVYGVPRMQMLFNRLYDLRKITGGSGEMFWKGGFPGYSFEMDPNARRPTATELETLQTDIANYADGLQRYIKVQGISVKSLSPQVADPKSHVDTQLEYIAIAMGVPKRIFMGAEQAKLASTQDSKAWNKRIARRQNKYLTPYVVRPFVDRMIAFGVLPEVEDYWVEWQDLNALSEMEQAEVLAKKVEAFSKYVSGGVSELIPPEEFLTMYAGLDPDEVKQIMDAALQRQEEMAEEEEARMAEEQARIEEEDKRKAEEQRRASAAAAE